MGQSLGVVMPIRPENRALYPADWTAIRRRIRHERAGNRCERCKAPNHHVVARETNGSSYMLMDGRVYCADTGEALGWAKGSEYPLGRMVKIVLTVAHLDHDPTNNADENLQALCQRCHLRHDHAHHQANAAATRRARKAGADLFAAAP